MEPLPSARHGAQGSDGNEGKLNLISSGHLPGGFEEEMLTLFPRASFLLLPAGAALCSQQIIAACGSCRSFRFIPCRRPPAAIKSHPQISVSIIFSSPPSFIPYKVRV